MVLSTIATLASVFMTRVTGDMSQAALEFDTQQLLNLLILITALMAVQAVCAALSALLLGRFSARVGYRFRDNFARYFLRLPFIELEKDSSGESLSIFSNDLPRAVQFVSQGGLQMVADFITLIVTLIFMITINWWLTLLYFGMFPVLIVMQVLISLPIQKKQIKMSEGQANFNAIVNDSLQNVSTIAAYSLEDVLKRRYMRAFNSYFDSARDFVKSMSTMVISGIMVTLAPMLLISVMAASRVIGDNMSIAEFIAFTALAFQAGTWLMMLSQRLTGVQVAAAGAKRLGGHMALEIDFETDFDIPTTTEIQAKGDVAVQFSCVDFSYAAGKCDAGSKESSTSGGASPEHSREPDAIREATPVDSREPAAADEVPSSVSRESSETNTASSAELPLALSQINITIPKGAKVAFVGGSGSGKSTVLKLILGLYTPTKGEVEVFGFTHLPACEAVSSNTTLDTTAVFSYVPQDSFLFPESIGENITGTTTPDAARLETACRDAGIWDFINSLPNKFDSELAESAENVSGGQKQRIALARALYQDAPIILFDEATSALDPTTEAEVLKSFEAMISHNPDKTVIMVAHRPKAIAFCDTIVLMENGKIIATGTHDDLMATCPEYAALEVSAHAN